MTKKYYLGLDIGTNSCGWAVTDENYELLRAKGKDMWGVRLFESAETAADRRIKRTNRRRLVRRKLKLQWLREIFEQEIGKLDPTMLNRIKYSALWEDDKLKMDVALNSKDSLFNTEIDGKKYTDKEFFKEYPTIYHLRQELTCKPAKDVRFLYLALHNIIKRRGHFLYEGEMGANDSLVNLVNAVVDSANEYFSDEVDAKFNLNTINLADEIVINDFLAGKSKDDKGVKINNGVRNGKLFFAKVCNASSKKEKIVTDAFVSGKLDVKTLFNLDEKLTLEFTSDKFDEDFATIESMLTEEQVTIIESIKSVYENIQLRKVLGDNEYLCDAMVNIYNDHSTQLKMLKSFVKDYYPNKYYDVFRNDKLNSIGYSQYVNGNLVDGEKKVVFSSGSRDKDEFYKYIKSILNSDCQKEDIDIEEYSRRKQEILGLIEDGNFLNKQRTKANAVFPNALYKKEVEQILRVNSVKFPFLQQKDETGLTNAEKIVKILTFRIPYFVGPIGSPNNEKSTNAWAVKEQNLDFKPWTLDKIINFDKSEDLFIKRMTNKCSYIPIEDVLPKNSIVYAKFRVLNELNNLQINGEKISVNLKQKIFTQLFEKEGRVTVKKLINFLVNEGIISKDDVQNIVISGIDKEFANNYMVYTKLANNPLFGKDFVDDNIDVFEQIIKYHTIISDKNRLIKRVSREYGKLFNDEQLKVVKGLNYSDWGRLSNKLLNEPIFVDKKTGVWTSVLEQLWETNYNLQYILNADEYTLRDVLNQKTIKTLTDLTYDEVNELYCSPAVKRGVWQAIKIIKEITQLQGCAPEKIFIEVTRHDEEKGDAGRKLSRKKSLENLLNDKDFKKSLNATKYEIEDLLNQLSHENNQTLRSEKLYLYFLQLGKCAYSGEPIDITQINNKSYYDVDHIIPQSIIKDDSINNKVLVKSKFNKLKDDTYPIFTKYPDWVNKQQGFWEYLNKVGLMSDAKLQRLIRKDELKDQELGDFIARQLVETNQSAKAVVDLLRQTTNKPNNVVLSKAHFVSEFRNKYEILKNRTVNDLHHAKDAYLNIVVGNVLHSRFTQDPRNFYKTHNKNSNLTKNTKKLFDFEVFAPQSDKLIWAGQKDVERIKKICQQNSCLVSRMSFTNMNGMFYDETVYKSTHNDDSSKASVSLKQNTNPLNNVERYGGYNSQKNAYFMVIESEDKKGNKIKTIEAVPVLTVRQYINDANRDTKIFEAVVKQNELKNAKCIMPKINIQSTLKIGNGEYLLAGKSGNSYVLHNANQWFANTKQIYYVRAIEKYMQIVTNKLDNELVQDNDKIVVSQASKEGNKEIVLSRELNIEFYDQLIDLLSRNVYEGLPLSTVLKAKLVEKREMFIGLPTKNQCLAINGILKAISTGASSADMSELGDGKTIGKIMMNKNITGKNISLVLKSSTGLQEKIIRL